MSISFWFKKDETEVYWACEACGETRLGKYFPTVCPNCEEADCFTQFTEAKHHLNFSNTNALNILRNTLGYKEADHAGEISSMELLRATSGALLLEKLPERDQRRVEGLHELAKAAIRAEDYLIHWG